MIQRVAMEGLSLPRLYIAENKEDEMICVKQGIPYIKWTEGVEELVKILLRPMLEKNFPYINWNKVLGRKRRFRTVVHKVSGRTIENPDETTVDYDKNKMLEAQYNYDANRNEYVDEQQDDYDYEINEIADIADGKREFDNGVGSSYGYEPVWESESISTYVGDLTGSVDIEVLQKLSMLPKFMGDIADCIKTNLSNNMYWTEGYNKKLGVPVGRFNGSRQLPNLIILDISASIPRGIAATMLSLIDTMRGMCSADLIITASRSGFYSMDDELPSADTLRKAFPPGQESKEFMAILKKHVKGREFGHVICFGDDDAPSRFGNRNYYLEGTKVHELHSYHTFRSNCLSGYCEWVPMVNPSIECKSDTSWCNVMVDN